MNCRHTAILGLHGSAGHLICLVADGDAVRTLNLRRKLRVTSFAPKVYDEVIGCVLIGTGYNIKMEQDLARTLIARDRIEQRVIELGREIAATYEREVDGLVLVPVLAGSLIFVADLMRQLPFKMHIGLMTVSRYRGKTVDGGETRVIQDLTVDIANRHVLVVDDILDTGKTLRSVTEQLRMRNPKSLRICTLLRKPARAPKDFAVDFVGFDVEDVFVVGYGLDYNDQYRNWPEIGVLRPELYA